MKRVIGLTAAMLLSVGALLSGTATSASANGDYAYVGSYSDGQGGMVYQYQNSAGQGAYFDSWQGLFWSSTGGGTLVR